MLRRLHLVHQCPLSFRIDCETISGKPPAIHMFRKTACPVQESCQTLDRRRTIGSIPMPRHLDKGSRTLRTRLAVAMVALASATAMLCASPALAAERAVVQAFLAPDGSGELIAEENFREGKGWRWQACAVDLSGCVPFAEGAETTTANAAPETVFRATSRAGASALSPVWHGNVKSLTPPSVSGELRANELVRPMPGTWSGGWDGDYDWTQLAACTTEAGTGCITLTDQHFNGSCRHGSAVLDPAFVGRYLRVADQRVDAEAGIELYAVSSPYHPGEIWQAGPLASIAVVGRIQPARSPRRASCGPPPITEKASISRDGIATISCTIACRATMVAKRGKRVVRVHGWALYSKKLRLSRRQIAYLGNGAIHLNVLLDGRRVAHRTVRGL
jgi:hypothetical protein